MTDNDLDDCQTSILLLAFIRKSNNKIAIYRLFEILLQRICLLTFELFQDETRVP